MTRNEIITELYKSSEIDDVIAKMQPVELHEDLKSEVFAVLLELPEENVVEMYKKKVIKFWIVRTIINMIKSDRSTFYNRYRNFVEIDEKKYLEFNQINENEEQHELYEKIEKNLDELHWYNAEILRLYATDANFNAKSISKLTQIPYISIIRTLHKTKKELKNKIRNGNNSQG